MSETSKAWLPEGWTYEPRGDAAVIGAPWGFVTLDYQRRGYCGGIGSGRRLTSATKYTGRGWQDRLHRDAVAWLEGARR